MTVLPGVRVGHWTDPVARTGCTVVLMPPGGAVASCEVRGGAPAARETALLDPTKSVQRIHALVLSGGSAFGLAAAQGVMDYLEAAGEGLQTPSALVPIVPGACIYDLFNGDGRVRPGPAEGMAATRAASADAFPDGALGAGTGAMCGKYLGLEHAEPGGLGSHAVRAGAATVAALVVATPAADVVDERGETVAGARLPDGSRPTALQRIEALAGRENFFDQAADAVSNTTLVAVGTDAPLTKAECRRLAEAAHAGLSRVMRPSHLPSDGDISFAFTVGTAPEAALPALLAAAQEAVAAAALAAVRR